MEKVNLLNHLCFFYINVKYRKIPKISPGAYIFQRPLLRGLSTDGNLRFKIDWVSLIFGSKSTVFALFYVVFEGNLPSTSPWGLIFGGAYTWRGLFSESCVRYSDMFSILRERLVEILAS